MHPTVNSFLRHWRIWWLALAVAVAPQLASLHALSHLAPSVHAQAASVYTAAPQAGDDRQQAPEQTCDTCVAYAQLGHAATGTHAWAALVIEGSSPQPMARPEGDTPPPAYFQARAPPIVL